MAKAILLSTISLLILNPFQHVFAVPSVGVAPKFIPGPGLPSLESLNLTYADLMKMPTPEWARSANLQKRVVSCASSADQCTVNDAVACYNFLTVLDTVGCGVDGPSGTTSQFCYAGDCTVVGMNVGPNPSVSSYCRDVAFAVSSVAYGCGPTNGRAGAGIDKAWGNGDLAVALMNQSGARARKALEDYLKSLIG